MADIKATSMDAIGQAATKVKDTATDAANYVAEQSESIANSASAGISSATAYLNDRANDATSGIASGLKSAGQTVQGWSPRTGQFAATTRGLGQGLSRSGEYLADAGLTGIEHDLVALIKKNPLPAIIMGIGLGYLLTQFSRRRN